MTNQEIYDLIARFETSSLQSMKLSQGDFSLELTRGGAAVPAPAAAPMADAPAHAAESSDVVTAPLVGVYYAAPAPGEAPFVSVGDKVSKGQTLCLIEAMKMLSEVPAPCDCIITDVLKENAALASFGEALFRYKPC